MSVKKEANGRRSVQAEVIVPGTPEEVWQAIATGPGVSSWFVPTEMRDDGKVVAHFGPGMDAVASTTEWDPPRRFAAEGDGFAPGCPPLATEWIVEARAGGTCLVRVVHSLFAATDDWDDQLEAIGNGWPDYFRILRLYLTHFRDQPGVLMQLMAMVPEPAADAWESLAGPLGLLDAGVGERRVSPPDAPTIAGVVEAIGEAGHPHQIMLLLDQPLPGIAHLFAIAMGGMVVLMARIYLYGDQAAETVAREQPTWQSWLDGHFGPPPTDPSQISC